MNEEPQATGVILLTVYATAGVGLALALAWLLSVALP
jgi:hypothetical protein